MQAIVLHCSLIFSWRAFSRHLELRHGISFSVIKGLFRGFVRAPVQVPTSLPTITSSQAKAKIAADVWRREFMSMSLSSDKPSNTSCPRSTQGVCGLDSDKVAHKNFTRLELQDRHCNNFCFLTALGRFGRIQTKGGPATPPPLCHVGSFRGHQGSPTDPLSCQGGPGSPLLLAD